MHRFSYKSCAAAFPVFCSFLPVLLFLQVFCAASIFCTISCSALSSGLCLGDISATVDSSSKCSTNMPS